MQIIIASNKFWRLEWNKRIVNSAMSFPVWLSKGDIFKNLYKRWLVHILNKSYLKADIQLRSLQLAVNGHL